MTGGGRRAGRRRRVVRSRWAGNGTETVTVPAHGARRDVVARVALAVVALGAACGDGGSDAERESAGATTTTSVATTAAPSGEPSASAPPTSARGVAPSGSTTTAATTTSTTARPAAPAGAAFTPPGSYRYATTGQFTSSLTGSQPRNGTATLTVDPPSGADQRSVRRAFGRTTEQVLRLEAGGAYLVSLHLTDTGVDKEVRPTPPALALPADAAPGRTWAWRATSTDGLTTVDSAFRAVRTEDVVVGGKGVPALVVEVVLTFTGDVVSTSRQTVWVSGRDRLIVRQDESTDGRLGIVTFSSTSSDTLVSLTPD